MGDSLLTLPLMKIIIQSKLAQNCLAKLGEAGITAAKVCGTSIQSGYFDLYTRQQDRMR